MDTLRNPDFWKDYHSSVLNQIEKINDLLKDLWLASERPPFHFTDKIRLDEVVARVLETTKSALAARNLRVVNNVPMASVWMA